jgi:hypothetical protein
MNLTPAKKSGEECSNPIFIATNAVDHKRQARTARAVTLLKVLLLKLYSHSANVCILKIAI